MVAKVAVIEDNIQIQSLYKMKLETSGFVVVVANDGITGLELIASFRPQVILLDIRMPHMSGDEMLAKLRETEWGSSIKVIILTNLSKDEAPTILRFLGVDRYVVKAHYTPAQVVEIVREVLNKN